MAKVTDPALLEELEAPVTAQRAKRVTDPALIEQLDTGFDAGQMVRNIPGSAKQFASDLVQPFVHPLDTAKNVWKAGSGAAQLAIPGEQGNEPYARAVGQGLKERYGGTQALRRTLQNDPVGLVADAAGLVTGGGSLLRKAPGMAGRAGEVVANVGRNMDPVVAAQRAAGAVIPKAVPRKAMESALKLRTTLPGPKRADVVETVLAQGVMPNASGVDKLRRRKMQVGDKLDQLITQATNTGQAVPVESVTQGLDELRREYGRPSVAGAANLKAVDAVEQAFLDHVKRNGPAQLTVADLQNIKTDAYKRIDFDRSGQKADLPTQEAYASIARDARQEIEKQVPQIANVNRRYGEIERAIPEVERAANRIGNRDFMGIGVPIKIGAGTQLLGGNFWGGLAGLAAGAFDTPSIKARLALTTEALRKKGYGKGPAKKSYTTTRAATAQAGRLPEDQQE